MSKFLNAVRRLLLVEGGYSNHENDNGGATNYGVSLRFLKLTGEDLNGDQHIDEKDIEQITEKNAIELYKKYFWDHYKIENIFKIEISCKALDIFVNMRGKSAAKILQKSVNDCGGDIKEDGLLGKLSFYNINRLSNTGVKEMKLSNAIRENQAAFYRRIVEKDDTQKVFLNGWLARAAK